MFEDVSNAFHQLKMAFRSWSWHVYSLVSVKSRACLQSESNSETWWGKRKGENAQIVCAFTLLRRRKKKNSSQQLRWFCALLKTKPK